jgi:CRP-like cAMP-binding protein
MRLFETHPRLAGEFLWALGGDALLGERLITVGRRTARERVAHLLLELFKRLQRIELAEERSYRLPLTQEMISDALGLSIPYVNRVLHESCDDGLLRIRERLVVIEDLDGLSALADFEPGYLQPLSIAELLREKQ